MIGPFSGLRPSLPSLCQVSCQYDITVFFSSQHLPHSVIALFLFVHGLSLLLEYKLPGIRGCVFLSPTVSLTSINSAFHIVGVQYVY